MVVQLNILVAIEAITVYVIATVMMMTKREERELNCFVITMMMLLCNVVSYCWYSL